MMLLNLLGTILLVYSLMGLAWEATKSWQKARARSWLNRDHDHRWFPLGLSYVTVPDGPQQIVNTLVIMECTLCSRLTQQVRPGLYAFTRIGELRPVETEDVATTLERMWAR